MLTLRPGRSTVLLTALVAALLCAVPAAASALTYTVNSTGDAPDKVTNGKCETAVANECTLRAAIQESNASLGTGDRIEFSAVFNGQLADTITLGSDLPDLTDPVSVSGGIETQCTTEDEEISGPCVGIDADGHAGFTVATHDADIDGLAIGGATRAIDVLAGGEAFTLFNTWIGLNLKGESSPVDTGVEVAPGVEGVGIGAPEPFRRNVIANAGIGVRADEAPFLSVVGNSIAADDAGIEVRGAGATISENLFEGAIHGIRTVGTTASGSQIEANVLEDSGEAAIELQSPDNVVVGNEIVNAGAAGIQIDPTAGLVDLSGNRIGGDSPDSENAIFGSLGRAIEIVGIESSENEVGRNHGSGNGAEFIGLTPIDPDEPHPNGAIKPPSIATALQSTATGTAERGARVRVFRKATEEVGEIQSFLGEAVADGAGNWSVHYSEKVPVGTFLAVTQTNTKGGTSELAVSTSAADPAEEDKSPSSCPGATTSCRSNPPLSKAPDTKIAKKPKLKGTPTAKFKFTSSISGSSFECKLDKGRFKKCRSPKTYRKLKPGKHVFKVRAVSSTGVADPSPAMKKFKVKG